METYLEWNEHTQRYEAPLNERTFCVDQEAFHRAFDEATTDPGDDEYKVHGYLSRVSVWEEQLGTNTHVYYADQANVFQHRLFFHHDNGWDMLEKETLNDPRWKGITTQGFQASEPPGFDQPSGGLSWDKRRGLSFILTLTSKEPFPADFGKEIYQRSGVLKVQLDLPRHT